MASTLSKHILPKPLKNSPTHLSKDASVSGSKRMANFLHLARGISIENTKGVPEQCLRPRNGLIRVCSYTENLS